MGKQDRSEQWIRAAKAKPPHHAGLPEPQGLYHPDHEKDACGVGMICNIKGVKSRAIVEDAFSILCNLEHRGAVGADPKAGDGAGILIQLPRKFFAAEAEKLGYELPEPGHYGVGQMFLPRDEANQEAVRAAYGEVARE